MYIACMETLSLSTRCVYCGCSELEACVFADGSGCAWIPNTLYPVCTNPVCVHMYCNAEFPSFTVLKPQNRTYATMAASIWVVATTMALVDDESAVRVTMTDRTSLLGEVIGVQFTVDVAAEDVGKALGKGGNHARSIRSLLSSRANKEKTSYGLSINENKPQTLDAEKGTHNG